MRLQMGTPGLWFALPFPPVYSSIMTERTSTCIWIPQPYTQALPFNYYPQPNHDWAELMGSLLSVLGKWIRKEASPCL